jgi:NAD(P)-dependent dehydrogenase (short-subunit alcohol dehydrogenase family)
MNNPIQTFSLARLKALVTGASGGLGRHFAGVLASAGAEVICCSRSADKLAPVVAGINDRGGRARAIAMDVTDRSSIGAALDAAGSINVLVNNAGITQTKRLLDHTDDDWNAVIGTNLTGAWMVAQEAARRMVGAKTSGAIINITSILGSRVAGGVSAYLTSKAGLRHLTQSMALELARYNIRVNSLAPGYFVTDLNSDFLKSEAGENIRLRIPSRRFGNFEDLDGALLLLASPAGGYITGAEIVVDGGHLCSTL